MKNSPVSLTNVKEDPVTQRKIELVERKGMGHPDSISDGIAEQVSRRLCQEYRDRFGQTLHHNTDEFQLVAGSSEPEFGGGEVIEPIFGLLAGRATKEFDGQKIPVDKIAMEAARDYIRDSFKQLGVDDFELESKIGETSTDLKAVFTDRKVKSNDTSFGVGHAPLSPTERTVRKVEHTLHSEMAGVGEDVKVMGLRKDGTMKMTVAAAAIDSQVADLEEYIEFKHHIRDRAEEIIRNDTDLAPDVHVNTADEPEDGNVYLTVTGTSAEMGDDGSVGRGNRVNGLITPHRSMSLEAASGKNPVTHVGKIYNLLANQIAERIHDDTGKFAQVKILSQIGKPIDEPQIVEVETQAGEKEVDELVARNLDKIEEVTDDVIAGKIGTF